MIQAASSTDTPPVRAGAARALAHIEGSAALALLVNATEDSDVWVRYYAARSLRSHPGDLAIDALLRLAEDDSAPPARIAAIETLGAIGGNRAHPVLNSLLTSPNTDVARAAADALKSNSELAQ